MYLVGDLWKVLHAPPLGMHVAANIRLDAFRITGAAPKIEVKRNSTNFLLNDGSKKKQCLNILGTIRSLELACEVIRPIDMTQLY